MGLFDDLFKKQGMPEKINFLGKEYDVNPDAMVFSQQGIDKYQLGDYSGSITSFTKAINAQPKNPNFYKMRGTAYEDLGNDIEAEKDFRKTLELIPDEFVAAYRLGMVYFRKKDFENAIIWLKISFDNSEGINLEDIGFTNNNLLFVSKKIIAGNLGNFLTQVKKYEEGIKYLDVAIKIDPSYPNPYMAKGLALAQLGKIEEGIICLEIADKLGVAKAKDLIQILKNMHSKQEEILELDFVFRSSDHLRYENGRHISGPHGGAPRAIKVEANISGNEGYTVTMFNTEGGEAVVQMAPKQMKLIGQDNEKIQLKGFGYDLMGESFADYGLTIYHENGTIEKCILHMFDRNVDIVYLN